MLARPFAAIIRHWGHCNYAEIVLLWKGDASTAIIESQRALQLMNYPMARLALGEALYVKWANMPRPSSPEALTVLESAQDTKSMDWLVANKADINAPAIYNRTPFFVAVERNDVPLVKRLIRWKADVNIAIDGGETPLLAAAGEGYGEMARILLDAGADPSAKLGGTDVAGITAYNKDPDVARLISDHKPGRRK